MTDLIRHVAHTIGPHFVTLSCVQQPPGNKPEKLLFFSGFVVEIGDEWFYITAGHILRDIRRAQEGGSTLDVWRLGDNTARHSFKDTAVPFDFELDQWFVLEDAELGLDYAAVPLLPFFRRQLEVGGVQPIDRRAWGTPDMAHDHWVLAGTPSESVIYDGETIITARFVTVLLEPADVPPDAGLKAENQFYARLTEGSESALKNIDGMSGGPIFMLISDGDKWRYAVIGVQSGWYRSSRVIAACPFTSFALAIQDAIRAVQAQTINTQGSAVAP